jgi:hypothetical protein
LPTTTVTTGPSDAPVTFVGISLKALPEKAGVGFGESLRGKRLASCLLVEAADGYRVVIALPELDPAFTDRQIVLAFLRNGKPLDEKEGPYRIVIPDEKRMTRWVRQVTALRIVDVREQSLLLDHYLGGLSDHTDDIVLLKLEVGGAAPGLSP